MKYINLSIFLMLLPLSASNATENMTSETLLSQPLYSQAALQGKQAARLKGDTPAWVLTSERQGLIVVDQRGEKLSQFSGNYENLSLRHKVTVGDKRFSLIATVDKEQGNIRLLGLDQDYGFSLLKALAMPEAQAEALCLFRQPQGHISLFIADNLGQVHETIIYDAHRKIITELPVRSFTGVAEVQGCVVDDQRQWLYLAEGNIGVWRYQASAESDPIREIVDLVSPYGALNGEITGLSVSEDGSVWVTNPEHQQLNLIQPDNNIRMTFRFEELQEPETIAVTLHQGRFHAVVFDAATDSYQQLRITQGVPQADVPQHDNPTLLARVQTQPMQRFADAADDPAFWLNKKDPAKSLILGTDKRAGLMVYNLEGALLQSLEVGRVNNVDLRQHDAISTPSQTLIAASNRTHNSISLFDVDEQQQVRHLGEVQTNLNEIYGLCMYQSDRHSYVFVNDKDGTYQQYRIEQVSPTVSATRVRQFSLPSQPEGCSAEDNSKTLYMGEEKQGIWTVSAAADAIEEPKLIISVGDVLQADVEGMDVYQDGERSYLVVSSQGNNRFVVFGLWQDYPILTHFDIGTNLQLGIDGVSETDGLAVTNAALPGFPAGILIVQDGRNRMPQRPQNFKVIDWRDIQQLIHKSQSY
ncbi:phytase [Lacimicrobium sp. SS2-24]|uniref:phytase n=1 Tax=Lacimicrobium sp. SS2-24 TaxID=2005569 RepID=UPI000B4BC01D|nr:phytase [Lacimicrobium sp. SS2-24]